MLELLGGGRKFTADDSNVQFLGEVSGDAFITLTAFLSMCNMSGLPRQINLTEPWLRVNIDEKELYIAKKPILYGIKPTTLRYYNVITGSKIIAIAGESYHVRLFSGANKNISGNVWGHDDPQTHGCEWNRIMYRLHDGVHSQNYDVTASENPFIHLANYSHTDLGTGPIDGGLTICMETHPYRSSQPSRVGRGYDSISYMRPADDDGFWNYMGYRPVLQKVAA